MFIYMQTHKSYVYLKQIFEYDYYLLLKLNFSYVFLFHDFNYYYLIIFFIIILHEIFHISLIKSGIYI